MNTMTETTTDISTIVGINITVKHLDIDFGITGILNYDENTDRYSVRQRWDGGNSYISFQADNVVDIQNNVVTIL